MTSTFFFMQKTTPQHTPLPTPPPPTPTPSSFSGEMETSTSLRLCSLIKLCFTSKSINAFPRSLFYYLRW